MSALASRFPGALREIDRLELAEIRRRIERLEAVAAGACDAEPWMEAMSLFHRLARGALCAKRWLAGRQSITPEIEAAYAVEAQNLEFAVEALGWQADLAAIARPPKGRVTSLVHARVAGALGVTEADARRMVFGGDPGESARSGRRGWPRGGRSL
jgi:hypothetical protein